MTSEGADNAAPRQASGATAPLARLADLDRRIVPVVAMRLDRLLPRSPGTGIRRPPLGVRERRILAALAVLLLACAAALTLIGS